VLAICVSERGDRIARVLFRGSEAQAIGSVQWNLIKTPALTTPHAEIRT